MKKAKSVNRKAQNFNLKPYVLSFSFTLFVLSFTLSCYAKEIAIIYTGQTHGMIYPCSCPIEADGGIARRATLVKQIRKDHPNNLLLDSGDFFAAGPMDEYTQNTELDSQRSLINLKAMELMKYDAAAIGDDEFNFGIKFFEGNAGKSKVSLLSCNLNYEKALRYTIKEVAGTKIGIVGVAPLAAKQKAGNLDLTDPKEAISSAVAELKKNNVNIIILLSQLGDDEDKSLINDIKGIDIVIEGHSKAQAEPHTEVGKSLLLRPSWEGRRLDILIVTVEADKLVKYKFEETRLSDQIADDPDILTVLPKCFSDNNCKKENFVGTCKNPGTKESQCEFNQANKVRLLVIAPKECTICETASLPDFLKKQFPGLSVSYIYYPSKAADSFIKDFDLVGLPAYFLGKEVDKEKNFESLKSNLSLKGDYYMLVPRFSGFSYFLNRQKMNGKLDIFVSLYDKDTPKLLDVIKEFNPQIHFLAIEQAGKFDAQHQEEEVEEDLRAICVKKYYPQAFWDYISCRSKNFASSWWEDCAASMDANKIKACARNNEGKELLRENIGLNKDLRVIVGPAYLLDNQEIFGSKGVPSKEELKKMLKR